MGNVCTLAVSDDEYREIIKTLEHGFTSELTDEQGNKYHIEHRPNHRVAFALKLEYATGLRISDIVKLRQKDIVRDGDRYRLDIKETKTGKKRTSTISKQIYDCIDAYCAEHNIPSDRKIVGGTTYGIQKQLKFVADYLGLKRCSTHSLRKRGAQRLLALSNNNILAVQTWLNHSNAQTTYTYLASGNRELEEALNKMTMV